MNIVIAIMIHPHNVLSSSPCYCSIIIIMIMLYHLIIIIIIINCPGSCTVHVKLQYVHQGGITDTVFILASMSDDRCNRCANLIDIICSYLNELS